jgi:hypothetical protein
MTAPTVDEQVAEQIDHLRKTHRNKKVHQFIRSGIGMCLPIIETLTKERDEALSESGMDELIRELALTQARVKELEGGQWLLRTKALEGLINELLPTIGHKGTGADDKNIYYCEYCGQSHEDWRKIPHRGTCIVKRLTEMARGEG